MNEHPHDKPEFSDQGQPNEYSEAERSTEFENGETANSEIQSEGGLERLPDCPRLKSALRFSNFGLKVECRDHLTGARLDFQDLPHLSRASFFHSNPDHVPVTRLPKMVFALVTDDRRILLQYLQPFETPPLVMLRSDNRYAALFRLNDLSKVEGYGLQLPAGITLVRPGKTINLPFGENFDSSTVGVPTLKEIPELDYDAFTGFFNWEDDGKVNDVIANNPLQKPTVAAQDSGESVSASSTPNFDSEDATHEDGTGLDVPEMEPAAVVVIDREVAVPDTALTKHSLLGSEDDVAKFAVTAVALIGMVLLMSQFGMIYAEPNTGKTLLVIALLLNAIEEGRLDARLLYYVNADDNAGGLLEKLQLFREVGAHTLVPGYKGFEPENLIDLMLTMIKNRQCVGVVLVIDTLKNFTDLMDKKKSAQLGRVARRFQNAGGTFIGLAHTNKKPGPNGKPIYAGTTDFLEACDVACYILPVGTAPNGDKVVKFELFKRRGGGNQNEAYSFSGASDISYHQLVASVQKIDPDQMQKYEHAGQIIADKLVIDGICNVLSDGPQQKMALARTVAGLTKASRRQVVEILERYTGSDPAKQKWDFVVAERGAKVFTLHPPMEA